MKFARENLISLGNTRVSSNSGRMCSGVMQRANFDWLSRSPNLRLLSDRYPSQLSPSQPNEQIHYGGDCGGSKVLTGFKSPSEHRLFSSVQAKVGNRMMVFGERRAFLNGY